MFMFILILFFIYMKLVLSVPSRVFCARVALPFFEVKGVYSGLVSNSGAAGWTTQLAQ